MSLARPVRFEWLLGVVLIVSCAGARARADQVWTVSLDTSQLAPNYTGPFGLDFELIGNNGNTVTLSDFAFGTGGSAGSGPFLTGGAGGALGSTVSLNDSSYFFSDFNQQFTPGSTLTFTVDSTLILPPGGTPDNFSMAILEAYDPVDGYNPNVFPPTGGSPIHTSDLSGNDTTFNFDINGPGSTTVSTYGYNTPTGSVPITVIPQSVVAEPGSGVLMLLGVTWIATVIRRRHGKDCCGWR
jgi:hypothetical protein